MADTIRSSRAPKGLRGALLTLAGALALLTTGALDAPLNALRGGSGTALQASVGGALPMAAPAPAAAPDSVRTLVAVDPRPMALKSPILEALPAPEAKASEAEAEALAEVRVKRDLGSGKASFYGRRFAGRATASGERFDPKQMTAAHRTLPFGTRVRVTNERNGRSVVVRINDRGPFSGRRVLDVSRGAAEVLGMVRSGTARVKMEVLAEVE